MLKLSHHPFEEAYVPSILCPELGSADQDQLLIPLEAFRGSVGQGRCGKILSSQLAVEPLATSGRSGGTQTTGNACSQTVSATGRGQTTISQQKTLERTSSVSPGRAQNIKSTTVLYQKRTASLSRSKNLPSSPEHETPVLLVSASFCTTSARISSLRYLLIAFKQHIPNLASASLSVRDATAPEKPRVLRNRIT